MDAEVLYVLVNSDYRTSRSNRAEWYFKHVNTNINLHSMIDSSWIVDGQTTESSVPSASGDLQSPILSPSSYSPAAASTPGKSGSGLVPSDSSVTSDCEFIVVGGFPNTSTGHISQLSDLHSLHLGPTSEVSFFFRTYRLVFVIDVSTSMFSLTDDGDLRLQKAVKVLEKTLHALSKKIRFPITDFVFTPNVKISVIAHSETHANVLLQGWTLKTEEIDDVMQGIKNCVEEMATDRMRNSSLYGGSPVHAHRADNTSVHSSPRMRMAEHIRLGSPSYTGGLVKTLPPYNGPPVSGGDLLSMIRHAMIAVSFLGSDHASPGFVLITDETVCMGDAQQLERTLQMLRADGIMCSFIKVGSPLKENLWEPSYTNFGQVDYRELCQFICEATVGAHFSSYSKFIDKVRHLDSNESQNDLSIDLNSVQKSLLGWNYQRSLPSLEMDGFSWSIPQRKSYVENSIKAPLVSVLSIRLREGYVLKDFKFSRGTGTRTIQIDLMLFWKPGVVILYTMTSLWPPELSQETRVQAVVSANYDFLHQAVCRRKRLDNSEYVVRLMERFQNMLLTLNRTDLFLEHLHRFSSISASYTVPSQYQNGLMSVFEYQPGTNISRPTERNITDKAAATFVEYWSRLKDIDMNTSHRWMHTHCVNLILEHDFPLPRHLSVPSSSGKFTNIQCKQAVQLVNQSLRNWASFTMIENHSYIKFIYPHDKSSIPSSFYLIRLGQHSISAVSLKFAFLAGTTASDREKRINELKQILQSKMFPGRGKNADPKARHRSTHLANYRVTPMGQKMHIPPLQRDLSETPCCTIISRHLDRVIVSFDQNLLHPHTFQLRSDITGMPVGNMNASMKAPVEKISSKLRLLSHHLHHRRRVWVTDLQPFYSTSSTTLSHMFYSLIMIRLQQGFHFLQCKDGFLNLYLDIHVGEDGDTVGTKTNSCSIQYILYLHRVTRRSRNQESMSSEQSINLTEKTFSTPEEESSILIGDQIVSEVWIEPQVGRVIETHPEIKPWAGKTFEEIPNLIFEQDLSCIQTYFTLEQLRGKYLPYEAISQPPIWNTDRNSTRLDLNMNHVKGEYIIPNLTNLCMSSPSLILKLALFRSTDDETNSDDTLNVFISHFCEELCAFDRFVSICISDREAQNFAYEVTQTLSSKRRDQRSTSEVANKIMQCINQSSWRCFVKVCEDNPEHLTIVVIPSSVKALRDLDFSSDDEFTYLPVFTFVTSRLYMGYIQEDPWTYVKPPHQEIRINEKHDALTKEVEKSIKDNYGKSAKGTEKLTEEMEKLARHIIFNTKHIIRFYSAAYLESVYLCLQKRLILHVEDLEYAFDNLCNDLPPLEIDITRYLMTVCGHCCKYKPSKSNENRCISLSDLQIKDICERKANLHARIRLRVQALVGKYFTQIPNFPHYFVFRPLNAVSPTRSEGGNDSSRSPDKANDDAEMNGKTSTNSRPGGFEADEDDIMLSGFERRKSFIDAEIDIDDELEADQHLSAAKRKLFPFFFHIGCTVMYKDKIHNIVVDHIPTCLGEFLDVFTNEDDADAEDIKEHGSGNSKTDDRSSSSPMRRQSQINMNDIKITLDLYPLTMRDDSENDNTDDEAHEKISPVSSESEPDVGNDSNERESNSIVFKPQSSKKQMRYSDPSLSSSEEEDDDEESVFNRSGMKSYNILPPAQRRAFDTCKEELEWILRDEIICCMKYEKDIFSPNLGEIVDHINCIIRQKDRFIDVSSVLQCISLLSVRLRFVLSWKEGKKNFFDLMSKATFADRYKVVEIDDVHFLVTLNQNVVQPPTWQKKDISSWRNGNIINNEDPPLIVDGLPPDRDMNKLWRPSAVKPGDSRQLTCHSVPFERQLVHRGLIYRSASLSELTSNLTTESRKTSATVGSGTAVKTNSLEFVDVSAREASQSVIRRDTGPDQIRRMRHLSSPYGRSSEAQSANNSNAQFCSGNTSPTSEQIGCTSGHRSTPANINARGTTVTSSSVAMFPSRAASSRGSLAGGYDGDFSSEEGADEINWANENDFNEIHGNFIGLGDSMTIGDSSSSSTVVPPFWLVLKLNDKNLEVYFHHTDTHTEQTGEFKRVSCKYCQVREMLLVEVDKMIRLVNQRMLLTDLQETRRCNSLLVPASQEEILWLGDDTQSSSLGRNIDVKEYNEDEEEDDLTWWYRNKLELGHFQCPKIWQENFLIDSRIKMTVGGRAGHILSNLRTALEQFAVTNRKDMYVMTFNDPLYIVLKEVTRIREEGAPVTPVIDLSASMDARSSIGQSMNQIPDDIASVSSFATTVDNMHQSSSDNAGNTAVNILEMTVYGISRLDKVICQSLNNLMQSKLDNLLLEILCQCLMRNSNLRLYSHDVRFIQPTVMNFNLCINLQLPVIVHEFLAPFSLYLKQHLNHFLTSPRFASKMMKDQFLIPVGPIIQGRNVRAATNEDSDLSGIGEAYVYNTYLGESIPTYGLACVVIQLVCGWNATPVEIIGSPLPVVLAGELHNHETDLRSLIKLNEIEMPSGEGIKRRKGPGPANYLRIFVWKRGDVDLEHLRTKLINAVSEACEDVLMEYRFLTIPIADEMGQLREMYAANIDDQPSSSATGSGMNCSPVKRRQSLIDKFRRRAISKSGGSPQEECPSPRPLAEFAVPTTSASDDLQMYMDLEAGDRGKLHRMFTNQILNWMEEVAVNIPSDKNWGWYLYFKKKFMLKSDVSISSFLELAVRCFHQSFSKGNIFQRISLPDGTDEWEFRRLVAPSSNERPSSGTKTAPQWRKRPGSSQRFLLIGRNYHHWCRFMSGRGLLELGKNSNVTEKIWHDVRSHQRLTGYDGCETSHFPGYCKIRSSGNVVIPRQIMCLLHVNGCEISFLSYNFSKDTNMKIAEQLSSLVEWHNSRFSLFTSIVRQKMGIFQGIDDTYPGFNSYEKAKHLVMMAAPPAQQQAAKSSSISHSGHFSRFSASHGPHIHPSSHYQTSQDSKTTTVGYKTFLQTLHTIRSCEPLPQPVCGHQLATDIIQSHGRQVLQARKEEDAKEKERNELEDMAKRWYLKMTTIGVAHERLSKMKSYCRLLHIVTSPLLFHPDMEAFRRSNDASHGGRSTQGSGHGQIMNRRKLSLAGEKKRHNSEGMCAAVTPGNRSTQALPKLLYQTSSEDESMCRLKRHLLMQYEQYLIRKLHFNETIVRNRQGMNRQTPYSLLYKSNFGGAVILVELLFRGAYFSVRVGAIEHQRLCLRLFRGNTTRETRLAFVDETDRLCHLTHLSSFMHDFHLRCVAHHIMSERLPTPWTTASLVDSTPESIRGSPLATLVCNEECASLLRPQYHIISFLEGMKAIGDGRPPLYSTNFLIPWCHRVDCNPTCCVVGDKLFDYILSHDHIYGLRNLSMSSRDTIANGEDYCLVDKENLADTSLDLNVSLKEFSCYTVITKVSSNDFGSFQNGLELKLFFIFVNAKQPFPNSSLERCRVSAKERRLLALRPCLLTPYAELRSDAIEVNYLGWDARLQRQIIDFLPQQMERWGERLRKLISHAAARAHKDNLWSRLFGVLLSPSAVSQSSNICELSMTVAGNGSSPLTRSLSERGSQLQLSALREIMDMGTVINLNEMDSRLAETLNFSTAYHDLIMNHVCQRFSDTSALFRCHQSEEDMSDLSAAVVLIHRDYRKAFLLITQNYAAQSTLTLKAVFQEADPNTICEIFYSSPLVKLVHAVAEICCFLLWKKLHN